MEETYYESLNNCINIPNMGRDLREKSGSGCCFLLLTHLSYAVLLKFSGVPLLFSAGYVASIVLAPLIGLPLNPQASAEAENILITSLAKIEYVWLQKKGQFLLGSGQPSIADLSLVFEIMQLEVLREGS